MASDDSTRRVQLTIKATLQAYGLEGYDVRKNNQPAICFVYQGQTRTIVYKGGDVRAHMNARTRVRHMLRTMGAQPVASEAEEIQPEEEIVQEEMPEAVAIASSLDDELQQPPEAERTPEIDEAVLSEDMATASDDVATAPPEGAIASPPMHLDGRYVVFNPARYRSLHEISRSRFIAINVKEAFLAEEGSVLVVALDKEDVVWNISQAEFRTIFDPIRPVVSQPARSPVVAKPVIEQPPENTVSDGPLDGPVGVEATDDEQPAPHFPEAVSDAPRTVRPSVSPQVGRVILAMSCLHSNGQNRLSANVIANLLSPVDGKQVGGLLGQAMRQRYVERLNPIDEDEGRLHHRLTDAGLRLAESLGTWPYDHRKMAVPPWLEARLAK